MEGRGGHRARALAVVLGVVVVAPLARLAAWPRGPSGSAQAYGGIEEGGALRLAPVSDLAPSLAGSCHPETEVAPGTWVKAGSCSARLRPLPLTAKRVLGQSVDLNALTVADLDRLSGIGPRLAREILAARRARGGFLAIDELDEVPGVGPARMAQLRAALSSSNR